MTETLVFLKKFLMHGTRISSAVPSSYYLAESTVRGINWEKARVIVELGAGTGALTQAILRHARLDTVIISIENDKDFCAILRDKYSKIPNLHIVEGDARDLEKILKDHGVTQADYIVSGLGFPTLPESVQKPLMAAIKKCLVPGGTMHQITEVPLLFQPFYQKRFKKVKFIFEPRNVPPGGVYVCSEPIAE